MAFSSICLALLFGLSQAVSPDGSTLARSVWVYPSPGEDAIYDARNRHVTPRSLYLTQLEERLGAEAVRNITDRPYRLE